MSIFYHAFLLFLFLTCSLSSNCQNRKQLYSDEKYTLIFGTFNHAEYLGRGNMLYKITDSSLSIINIPALSQKDTVIFIKAIGRNSLESIKSVRLDRLREFYYNDYVMGLSGNEYRIEITRGEKIKEISMHHYYHPKIELLVERLNKLLPDEYKINYLDKDTKQKCKLCRDFKSPPKLKRS